MEKGVIIFQLIFLNQNGRNTGKVRDRLSQFNFLRELGVLLQIFNVGGKQCHVRDVARLPFRQEIDSSRTNLIE